MTPLRLLSTFRAIERTSFGVTKNMRRRALESARAEAHRDAMREAALRPAQARAARARIQPGRVQP